MKVTIDITDEKQLALIERLRGEKTAKDFVREAADAGLKLAAHNEKQIANMLKFSPAKPEFKALDVAAITEALKDKDPKHPVKLEVGRLVKDYTGQLREHAAKNGNRLPSKLKVNAQAPIEQIAFRLTAEAISHAVKQAQAGKKTAAAK